jgi:pimeloyl-ACP methyl ester carboxylesterase
MGIHSLTVTDMRPSCRIAAIATVAGIASAAYQALAEARGRRRFPPPGRLVNIGGRCLHLVTAGEGSPAVVIIPALADNVLQWLPILEGVAAETRICVYDRAGVGWSDPPPHGRRTPGLMAADLRTLLDAAGILPPYVLAGHSIGGIVARQFYAQRPDAVAGIVLIDSSHEDQARRFDAAGWRKGTGVYLRVAARRQARILGARRLASSLGLLPGLDADIAREVPPGYASPARTLLLSTRLRRTAVREMLMMVRLRDTPPGLGSVPLTVLTALKRLDQSRLPLWREMQDELAALSADSMHITTRDAGHYVHLDDPDLVIQAIRDLVTRCQAIPVPGRPGRLQAVFLKAQPPRAEWGRAPG